MLNVDVEVAVMTSETLYFYFAGKVRYNLVKPARVAIAGCNVSLREGDVAIPPPRGDKHCEVSIFCSERDAVVAVPCIRYRLLFV